MNRIKVVSDVRIYEWHGKENTGPDFQSLQVVSHHIDGNKVIVRVPFLAGCLDLSVFASDLLAAIQNATNAR